MIFFQRTENDEIIFGITVQDIKSKFPHTSFSLPLNSAEFEDFGYSAYAETVPPTFSPWTHRLVEISPTCIDGTYFQNWEVRDLPAPDVSKRLIERKAFLLQEIDMLADGRFLIFYPQTRLSEYLDAGVSAKSFIDQGYIDPAPDAVLADSLAYRRTPTESANLIYSKYMDMLLIQSKLRKLRLNTKAAISQATSHQDVDIVDANFRQELSNIKPGPIN